MLAFLIQFLHLLLILLAAEALNPGPPHSAVPPDRHHHPNWTVDYENGLALLAFDFAAAAYSPTPDACLARHDAQLVARVQVPCDALKDEVSLCESLTQNIHAYLSADLFFSAGPSSPSPPNGSCSVFVAHTLEPNSLLRSSKRCRVGNQSDHTQRLLPLFFVPIILGFQSRRRVSQPVARCNTISSSPCKPFGQQMPNSVRSWPN
jgi:hypothetical protein